MSYSCPDFCDDVVGALIMANLITQEEIDAECDGDDDGPRACAVVVLRAIRKLGAPRPQRKVFVASRQRAGGPFCMPRRAWNCCAARISNSGLQVPIIPWRVRAARSVVLKVQCAPRVIGRGSHERAAHLRLQRAPPQRMGNGLRPAPRYVLRLWLQATQAAGERWRAENGVERFEVHMRGWRGAGDSRVLASGVVGKAGSVKLGEAA